jgi:hypothetical protein
MAEKTKTVVVRSGGIGFLGILTLIFITLKLTGHITWPWLWVLSPIWIPPAIGLGVLALIAVLAFVFAAACFLFGFLGAALGLLKK